MDPALLELAEAYKSGDLVLFVGAGVSAAAGLPSWKRLVELLIERAKARGMAQAALDEIVALSGKQQFIDALSALKDCLGPADFGEAIERHVDDKDIEELPEVALAIGALRPKLRAVLTTNLDGLLERAFFGAWPALPRATPDIAQRRRFILKLHGTRMDRSTWVFTRDEYDRAMHADEGQKQAFGAFFNACKLLFVGYGLSDDDFDAVLARVRAFAGDQPPRHFALVPKEAVTPYRRSRLEKSGVRLIAYDSADGRHGEVVRILRELGGVPIPLEFVEPTGGARPAESTGFGAARPPSAPSGRARPEPRGLGTLFGEPRDIVTGVPVPVPELEVPKPRLPHAQLRELHTAAIQLGLGQSRSVLLSGLPPAVSAQLSNAADPASQLLSDLDRLNTIGRLRDGTVLLVIWLENALQLTGMLMGSEVFRRALAGLKGQ